MNQKLLFILQCICLLIGIFFLSMTIFGISNQLVWALLFISAANIMTIYRKKG